MNENIADAEWVAATLGISISAVHRLCGRGTLPYRWVAGRRLFDKVAVKEFAASEAYRKRSRAGKGGRGTAGQEILDL